MALQYLGTNARTLATPVAPVATRLCNFQSHSFDLTCALRGSCENFRTLLKKQAPLVQVNKVPLFILGVENMFGKT